MKEFHAKALDRNLSFAWFLLFVILPCSISSCQGLSVPTTESKLTSSSDAAASKLDRKIITEQLGYLPPNFLSVSARNADGSPIAIKTYPLQQPQPGRPPKGHNKSTRLDHELLELDITASPSSWGTPFPTHYWLTCPDIARAIGDLERMGYTRRIADYLNLEANAAKRDQLLHCHRESGVDRWNTLHPSHRAFFERYGKDYGTVGRMQFFVKESGIAGLHYQEQLTSDGKKLEEVAVKCLHTHYAHFCSTSLDRREPGKSRGAKENPIGRITHDLLRTNFPSLCL